MNISEIIKANRIDDDLIGVLHGFRRSMPVECADGLRLSVQASENHYCDPKAVDGPWTSVEVGFPSARVEALMPYAEDIYNPTETVYGYVPIAVVERIIDEHGGIKR